MTDLSARLQQIYASLRQALGPQDWWPGDTPLEIAVGAILTQNTNWTNVEKAIRNLKAADALSVQTLARMSMEDLAPLLRPSGYFNIKAQRLKNFIAHIEACYDSDLERFLRLPTEQLRQELLSISGIGPETADSIALYAGNHPVFVVDAYTKRILVRHAMIAADADYHAIQDFFEQHLPRKVPLYNDFHAQLVMVGKKWCKTREPDCEHCPLKEYLPEDGPRLL